MAEDIHIGLQSVIPASKRREEFLAHMSEWTACMLGGRLSFHPTGPFTTHSGNDPELLPAGYIIAKEETRIFRAPRPMDSVTLAKSMHAVCERLKVTPVDMRRTEKGLWIGIGTLDRLVDKIEAAEKEASVWADVPGGPLPYENFANAFLKTQGKQVAR